MKRGLSIFIIATALLITAPEVGAQQYTVIESTTNLGSFTCFGAISVLENPNNPNEYIITWQNIDEAGVGEKDYDIKSSRYDAGTGTFTEAADVFDTSQESIGQQNPRWDYFGNEYHMVFAQQRRENENSIFDIVSIGKTGWQNFADYTLSENEIPINEDVQGLTAEPGPRIMRFSSDKIWVVYRGDDSSLYRIQWTSADGWDTDAKLFRSGTRATFRSSILYGSTVYAYWYHDAVQAVYLRKSDDDGASWTSDTKVADIDDAASCTSNTCVERNGRVYLFYNTLNGKIKVRCSFDGENFSNAFEVMDAYAMPVGVAFLDDERVLIAWGDRQGDTCSVRAPGKPLNVSIVDIGAIVGWCDFPNDMPLANAGNDQTVLVGDPVILDGSSSYDPDEDYPLTYAWTMASQPAGSTASLTADDTAMPTFTPDLAGDYTIELVVTDSLGNSSTTSMVSIRAIAYGNLLGRVRGESGGWEVAELSEIAKSESTYDTLNAAWPEPVIDRDFVFEYHASTGLSSFTVDDVGTVYSHDTGLTGYGFGNVYLQAIARDGDALTISNIVFNGTAQPDFEAPDNWGTWSRTLYSGKALADIVVSGRFSATGLSQGSAEGTKFQVRVDNEPPAHNSHETHWNQSKGPRLGNDCGECHLDPNGAGAFLDGADLANTTACDNCHSPGGAFDGVHSVDGSVGAKDNWNTGVYEEDGVTLQSGKEKWCAGCHDDVPAYSRPEVVTATEVVVDNADAEFEALPASPDHDRWRCKAQSGAYQGTRCHDSPGTGFAKATWTPNITDAGDYAVYGWWVAGRSRATDAPYTIFYDGGSETVDVNQKIDGSQWNYLGTYPFAKGTSGSVVLADDSDGYVIADAIKFELDVPGAQVGTFAPNVTGDNTTYGFYKTGHKIACLSCHDAGKGHIDHEHRTYESALDNYQAGYRLRSVHGAEPMNVPRKQERNVYGVLGDFALCFSCHNCRGVLGLDLSDVSHTNFWNDGDYKANLHTYHLEILDNRNTDSDFSGLGDTAPTCTGCHNVHGAPNQAMIRHGELINVNDTFRREWAALNFSYVVSMRPPIVSDPTASLADSVGGVMHWAGTTTTTNGVCNAGCHGLGPAYERVPKIWPKVINAKAEPSTVPNNGCGSTLITAFVSNPDGGTGSIKVNLSSIGGVADQDMYDNATNGDVTSGDGTYSYLHDIPWGTSEGDKTLLVTATDDAANTGGNVIILSVTAPGAIVVDDEDPGFEAFPVSPNSDKWGCKVQTGAYGAASTRFHNTPGNGSAIATWTPNITDPGDYEVFARWVAGRSRATDAPYTIYYDGGSVTVDVNQKTDGSQWNSLGIFPFISGTSGYVVLSDHANGYVIADAVKLKIQP